MVDGLRAKTVDHGFAFVRPPGHHAHCHKSWGFCLVNNLAVGVKYALTRGFNRVFVFDIDAHHGDGTQSIFYQDPNVFYCSIHTAESFPKTGLPEEQGEGEGFGFNLNCVVPKGVSANAYLEVFHDQVRPAIEAYKPDLVLVSAGFDGLDTDPMQIMKLEPATYGTIVAALKEVSQAPVGLVLEGGYDVSRLNHCYHACISSLLG
ncbi:Histone deacetylase [uncultured virus]|nr:Histone deacetylase [uncultured virus]